MKPEGDHKNEPLPEGRTHNGAQYVFFPVFVFSCFLPLPVMISQKPLKVIIAQTKMPTGSEVQVCTCPWASPKFITLLFFFFFPFPAQIGNLEPLGTNEKMKGIVIIIALVP